MPVIFGPKHSKFMEATQLIEEKGAFSINNFEELSSLIDKMITDKEFLNESGKNAGNFVTKNLGASEAVLKCINL